MSPQKNQHIVLDALDEPIRLLFWTLPECVCLFVPLTLGFISDHPWMGMLIGGGLFQLAKQFGKHRGWFPRWLYRALPSKLFFPGLAPSHIERFHR